MDSSVQPFVLCVDDDRVTLRLMQQLLAASGYRVSTAENGAQALAQV